MRKFIRLMEKRAKICIVGPGINMGGVERASTNLANYFSEQGYPVVFISIFKGKHFFNLHKNIEFVEPVVENEEDKINKVYGYDLPIGTWCSLLILSYSL